MIVDLTPEETAAIRRLMKPGKVYVSWRPRNERENVEGEDDVLQRVELGRSVRQGLIDKLTAAEHDEIRAGIMAAPDFVPVWCKRA